jgi:glycosyltransferase involved in cell wall biosynthesis
MFNAEAYLALAVESVRAQVFEDWELVLYDDGSRDRTPQIARTLASPDPRIKVVEGINGGTARARNRGLAAAAPDSEFVIFLDNDDTWEPDALAVLVRALDEQTGAPAAHGVARAIDPRGQQFAGDDLAESMANRRELRAGQLIDVPLETPTTFEALLIENHPVTPGTTLIRRRVWEDLGGYVAETVPCDDWDMNLRIARRGAILLVNRVILNWRRHPGAASHNSRRWRDAYLLVRRRTVLSSENTAAQRAAAAAAFQLSCRHARTDFGHELIGGRVAASARALARWVLYQTAYWRVARAAAT